jgi:hypothetical protein
VIYVDMDGVVADFDGYIRREYGKSMEEMSEGEMEGFWQSKCVSWRVFARLQPIPEGLKLVEWLRSHDMEMCFLTSTGGGDMHHSIMEQKIDWLHNNIRGSFPVAFCTGTASKATFAGPNHYLIDDRKKVVDAFVERGGWGSLFSPDTWEECLRGAVIFSSFIENQRKNTNGQDSKATSGTVDC